PTPEPAAPLAPVAVAAPSPEPPPPAPVEASVELRKRDLGPKPMHIPVRAPEVESKMTPRKPAPSPLHQPIRLRTWLMVLLALAAIWMFAKPGGAGRKLEARIDAAVALTADCNIEGARAELALLKTGRATAPQLLRLRTAIGAAAPRCEKKRLRAKAWSEAGVALEAAMRAGQADKAAARLAVFTRRWGEDADTREWEDKIAVKKATLLLDQAEACLNKGDRVCLEARLLAAERLKRPELSQRVMALRDSLSKLLETALLGAPSAPGPAALNNEAPNDASNKASRQSAPARVIGTNGAPFASDPGARKILADAERELAQGNYRGAIDKLEACAATECQALKQKAERLNRDMRRCLASGADWIDDRCN
ncbi:MAG TPA: hypothetical protein DCW29_17265, partial [Janthinobacterium sp.]|nr:hypothetical protein [Janthinobacterium sp.]